MWDQTALAAASLATAVIAPLLYSRWCRHASQPPLPPSPRSYPLIGNLLSMPSKHEHLGFVEIAKQLNTNMFSLSVLGTVIVVLNDMEDAVQLLEKRSSIYSDRPRIPMLIEPSLLDCSRNAAFTPNRDWWKKSRRVMHQWLNKQAAVTFQPSQQYQARLLLQRLLHQHKQLGSSEDLEMEVYRTTAGTILYSVYGWKVDSIDDEFTFKAKLAAENIMKGSLGSNFLVNVFPALNQVPDWFPGTGWKKTAAEWRKGIYDAINSPYQWTKAEMKKNIHEPSMIESMLEQAEQSNESPDNVDEFFRELGFVLLTGGIDTITGTIMAFFIAMIRFPAVQARAQEEISLVIGPSRLPTMEDQARLPYVERLTQELLRWCPTVPNGVPHVCTKDDIYKGYRIPEGAIVFGNAWAMSRNAGIYSNPEIFEPDRFLDASVPLFPAFGFGRRSCPGIHYAKSFLFICIASILATFNIEMTKDEQGNGIVPTLGGKENVFIFHPMPFKFRLVPQSSKHVHLIKTGA